MQKKIIIFLPMIFILVLLMTSCASDTQTLDLQSGEVMSLSTDRTYTIEEWYTDGKNLYAICNFGDSTMRLGKIEMQESSLQFLPLTK